MAAPKQTDPQFKIRLSEELKIRIESAAEKNNRSMNAEIVARLDASFRREDSSSNIKFDMALLDEKAAEQMARYLAKAAMVLISSQPETLKGAKKDHKVLNAMLDSILDEHDAKSKK